MVGTVQYKNYIMAIRDGKAQSVVPQQKAPILIVIMKWASNAAHSPSKLLTSRKD